MKVKTHAFDFLRPYIEDTDGIDLVEEASQADFVLSMNNAGHDELIEQARDIAHKANKPFCWWTCEDPNSCLYFLPQARLADYVFTSDACMIPWYREQLGHDRIYWLPLAAAPKYHHPLPLAEDATDFVFSGNWYDNQNEARKWGTKIVILPLAQAGYSMTIYSYEEPPYDELKPFWKGDGGGCRNVAEQYRHGHNVLGNNNQRSGMDGREKTVMCSMRVFEALACEKPFISPRSDAYKALGFEKNEHLYWTRAWSEGHPEWPYQEGWWAFKESYFNAQRDMAPLGRAFVLARHTYRHRMERILSAINGTAIPDVYWAYSEAGK